MPGTLTPRFNPERARAHLGAAPSGMRRGKAIYALARHRAARSVDGVSIADPGWLAEQETLWPHLAPVGRPSPWLSVLAPEIAHAWKRESESLQRRLW